MTMLATGHINSDQRGGNILFDHKKNVWFIDFGADMQHPVEARDGLFLRYFLQSSFVNLGLEKSFLSKKQCSANGEDISDEIEPVHKEAIKSMIDKLTEGKTKELLVKTHNNILSLISACEELQIEPKNQG